MSKVLRDVETFIRLRRKALACQNERRSRPIGAGPLDKFANDSAIGVEGMGYATARCRIQSEADNRVEAEGARPPQ